MRIALALLADHAIAHQIDGKLYVTGGGIRSLSFPFFPATRSHLALALGIEVDPEERGKEHSLEIQAIGPTDRTVVRPVSVTFSVAPAPDGPRADYIHFVSNMENVAFHEEGVYTFIVSLDGAEGARLSLRAERSGDIDLAIEAAAQAEAGAMLAEGYVAFSRGDTATAEELFRGVVAKVPANPRGHNNLGFVLLARGDAENALRSLETARRLGYPEDEIADANLAAALYLSGRISEAMQLFVNCLETRLFRTEATLFGIEVAGLFTMLVVSAAEYTWLMALNAAWSAQRLGDQSAAVRLLTTARGGDFGLADQTRAAQFLTSLAALEAEVRHPTGSS